MVRHNSGSSSLLNYDRYASCCLLTSIRACHRHSVCAWTRSRAGWGRLSGGSACSLRATAAAPTDRGNNHGDKQQAYHRVPPAAGHRDTEERQGSYDAAT